MLAWLNTILPAGQYGFIQYLVAAVLIVCFCCITLSVFFGIFSAIFRR